MMTDAIEFFREHGALCVRPGETDDQARDRCAREYADDEREAASRGWFTTWAIDRDADTEPGDGYFVSGNPQWTATLWDDDGNILEALGGIDFDKDYSERETGPRTDPYARVVAAELAEQALAEMREAY